MQRPSIFAYHPIRQKDTLLELNLALENQAEVVAALAKVGITAVVRQGRTFYQMANDPRLALEADSSGWNWKHQTVRFNGMSVLNNKQNSDGSHITLVSLTNIQIALSLTKSLSDSVQTCEEPRLLRPGMR